MANIPHKGGLPDLFSEIGFSDVKYFETTVSGSPTTIDIDPPASRIIIRNKSTLKPVFLRLDGQEASQDVEVIPGNNIKIGEQGTFSMDFDAINTVSLVASGTLSIEGILGFKGT